MRPGGRGGRVRVKETRMRAVHLALVLALAAPAVSAAEPSFIEQLAARGPFELKVSEGLEGPRPDSAARVFVEQGVMVVEIRRGADDGPEIFRYDGKGYDRDAVWSGGDAYLDVGQYCDGGGTDGRYEIACYSRSALRSRALRPPHTTWKLWLAADGLRVVRLGHGGRTALTPVNPAAKGAGWLAPGLEANLRDALAQLAAHQKGYLFGGSSGGGEWYASDLWIREVSGLDFRLERTVWPDRGGRSDEVPATWSFDYQGLAAKDPAALTWLMVRNRKGAKEADFWCVGRPVSATLAVACHKGGRPSDVRGKPDIAFRLEPFPEWRIYVEEGADNAFSSVGSTRLETLPFP
jgi:hypothetical protein